MKAILTAISILICFSLFAQVQATKRARDLGIPFEGTPGEYNNITDFPGVEVGYTTLISGERPLEIGKGPVRTGVTVILPFGKSNRQAPAGIFSLKGDGELTGSHFLSMIMGFFPERQLELRIPIAWALFMMQLGNGSLKNTPIKGWKILLSDFRLWARPGTGQ